MCPFFIGSNFWIFYFQTNWKVKLEIELGIIDNR